MPSPDHTSQTSTLSYPLVSSLRNSKAFPTWFQPTTKMLHLTFRIKYALLLKCRHSLLPSLLCQQRSVSQSCGFSSGHVRMWELDYKDSWAPKHRCSWTVVLQKTLESPLGCKEIQPVYPKGNQSWPLIGRIDAEAETPIVWPPDAKSWLIWKDLDAGKDWGWKEKGMTEDEMVGWHLWLNGHEFEWTLGAGDE